MRDERRFVEEGLFMEGLFMECSLMFQDQVKIKLKLCHKLIIINSEAPYSRDEKYKLLKERESCFLFLAYGA